MSSQTWGTGTDIFAVDYLDAQVPDTGNNAYHSADFKNHMLSAVELKRMTSHYESGLSTSTNDLTPQNAPLSLKQEGASTGYYRTFHYRSHPAETPFFSQNVLMYDRHIITNVSDIQRLVWKPTVNHITRNNVTMVDGTTSTLSYYQISQFESSKMSILKKGSTSEYTVEDINIVPAIISPDSEDAVQCFNYWDRLCEHAYYLDRVYKRYNQTYGNTSDNTARYSPSFNNGDDIILPNTDNAIALWTFDDTNNYVMSFYYKAGDKYSYLWTSFCEVKYYVKTEDELCHVLARSGVKFEFNGVIYKPIAENGVITGYTSDMTKESDWDKWHDYTDHDVPIIPPSGGGTGDELTDMLSRGQFYGSGLTKYYVDVPAAKLQKALGDWDNIATGKDVLQNLLSYKILCFPSTTFSNGMTDPFVIAGTELKDEDNNTITAKRLTSTGAVDLPGITITPTFNDFRDYAPYTKIQMFVPLCGWFDLPPWCMGRRITGEMYINPYSGTVRCLVRADGNVVAELGGNASIDLPFNATAVGMKSAAVISNLIQTAGAVGRAAMLPTVNTLAGAGSAALGTICAMNANYTESKGTMGDGSNVYGLYNVYIKITRPATIDNSGNSLVTIPAQYCHDYGRPCNKQLTLAAGDGYTQVMDANITGAMTDREKQMIVDGFRHGLIL